MSEATVKAHVSRVLTKLDMTNRVQAAILVHDAGLTRQHPDDPSARGRPPDR
jgi:DNA-binding NarL/FixJ family response regulator